MGLAVVAFLLVLSQSGRAAASSADISVAPSSQTPGGAESSISYLLPD
jgi:hypothetical protein